MTNWNYRRNLEANATNVMHTNTMNARLELGTDPFLKQQGGTANVPYRFTSTFEPTSRRSDLLADYIKKEQLSARTVAPIIKPFNNIY